MQAALQTGCRYGELCSLEVTDFNRDAGTLAIRRSKSDKVRHIVLTDEGAEFFKGLTAGRAGNEPMFGRQSGGSHQLRPMAEAVIRAKITPAISFHGLRHTWASHAAMNGVPLLVITKIWAMPIAVVENACAPRPRPTSPTRSVLVRRASVWSSRAVYAC